MPAPVGARQLKSAIDQRRSRRPNQDRAGAGRGRLPARLPDAARA